MKTKKLFSGDILSTLKKSKGLRVRAGAGAHRFIGIWFVMVRDRVFARSWSVKPNGWYQTFLKDPRGAIQVGKLEVPVFAIPIKNKALRDAVDRAYLKKYSTGGEVKYAKDLASEQSRATTVELVPFSNASER